MRDGHPLAAKLRPAETRDRRDRAMVSMRDVFGASVQDRTGNQLINRFLSLARRLNTALVCS